MLMLKKDDSKTKKTPKKVGEKELKADKIVEKKATVDAPEIVSNEPIATAKTLTETESPAEAETLLEAESPEVPDDAEAIKILEKFDFKSFNPGDTVRVYYKIIEGDKTRIQPFQGIVISKRGAGMSQTFMMRRVGTDGIGVERIFPFHSPNITKMEVVRKGRTRRAKLYYLREKKGRAATKVKEAI